MKRCTLFIPKEIDENTSDEDIAIQIKPLIEVCYQRSFVGNDYKHPLTITLLGCDTELLGIKATIYNAKSVSENGVFFIVNSRDWEFAPEERESAPKLKDYQRDEISDYSWLPPKLKKKGFKQIVSKLNVQYKPKEGPSLVYTSKTGPTPIEYLHNIFVNKRQKK